MDLSDLPRLLTVDQAAEFLRLRPDEVRQGVADGDLPVVRADGAVLVDTDQLLEGLGVDMGRCDGERVQEVST